MRPDEGLLVPNAAGLQAKASNQAKTSYILLHTCRKRSMRPDECSGPWPS